MGKKIQVIVAITLVENSTWKGLAVANVEGPFAVLRTKKQIFNQCLNVERILLTRQPIFLRRPCSSALLMLGYTFIQLYNLITADKNR